MKWSCLKHNVDCDSCGLCLEELKNSVATKDKIIEKLKGEIDLLKLAAKVNSDEGASLLEDLKSVRELVGECESDISDILQSSPSMLDSARKKYEYTLAKIAEFRKR